MKIIHTSDLHIGSPMSAHLEGERLRERRRELSEVLPRLIDEARSIGADAIIIAGDLFDTENQSRRVLDSVIGSIRQNSSLTFFYLPGNHEGDLIGRSFDALPKNLLIFGKEWTYFDSGNVTVCGRSDCRVGMAAELRLRPERQNIAVLHGELRESEGDGRIGIRELSGLGIDYLALGHYHTYSERRIDGRGVAVYSGSPEGRGFDEVGELGYVLIEADERGIRHSFRPFAKRRIRIVDVELDGLSTVEDIYARCDAELRGVSEEDMVRLRLCGRSLPELYKDTEGLRRRYGRRFFYLEVKDESGIRIDPRDYEHSRSLKGEFIRRVLADPTLDEKKRSAIIGCGIHALLGENYFDV